MKVTFFQRKPMTDNFSLEKVFETVRQYLPKNIQSTIHIAPYKSKGILPRIYNLLEAPYYQGDVNHITGDIHYVGYFLHKKKTILTILDCGFLQQPMSKISRFIIRFFWYVIPVTRSQVITTISESTKQDIVKITHCRPEKVKVIPVGVSPLFKFSNKTFNTELPTILHIGTAYNKNLINLIKALHDIKCKLVIVGHLNQEQLDMLKQKKIDYANYFNLTDEAIVRMYESADIVSFISIFEGFGMPIIEANAIGRPVITSNLSPMKDAAGEAACLVNPHDQASIREGILRIINDAKYRTKLIHAGQENIKKYLPEKIAEDYAELYRSL